MHCKSYSHFFSKKFQHICVSLNVNFNESLTNDVVSFEQLGPAVFKEHKVCSIDSGDGSCMLDVITLKEFNQTLCEALDLKGQALVQGSI